MTREGKAGQQVGPRARQADRSGQLQVGGLGHPAGDTLEGTETLSSLPVPPLL